MSSAAERTMQARLKVRAYKNELNPDGRLSLCGEPPQFCKETGREFFEIPAHQHEYASKLLTGYEFTDPYIIGESVDPPKKRGKQALPTG